VTWDELKDRQRQHRAEWLREQIQAANYKLSDVARRIGVKPKDIYRLLRTHGIQKNDVVKVRAVVRCARMDAVQ
jgi:DNA-binding NtrC family response regulator